MFLGRFLFTILIAPLILVVILFSSISHIYANDIFLYKNYFDDGLDSSWTLYYPNGSWYINSGELHGIAEPGSNKLFHYAINGDYSWKNILYKVKVKGVQGADKIVLFRVTNSGEAYGVNIVSPYVGGGNIISLVKDLDINESGSVIDLETEYFENSSNSWYDLEIYITDEGVFSKITVKVNGTKFIETIDENPLVSGKIGVGVWPEGVQHTVFDNIEVVPLNTTEFLNLKNYKQYSPPWNNEIYDQASIWAPNNSSISNWGCALTSAAMVLDYYGHNTNPSNLNSFLISQKDGYLRNGLLNWLALTRLTRSNNIIDSNAKILEYERFSFDNLLIDSFLNVKEPPILKLPGHFVVVRGIKGDDYQVNDPNSEDESLSSLESIYGNYTNIGKYTPTKTDLSYIMMVIDSDVSINVKNSKGETVGKNIIEDPIKNLSINQSSGDTVNVFLLPKPEKDNYFIELSGNNPTLFEGYFYDKNGNLINDSISTQNFSFPGGTKVYMKLFFDKEGEFKIEEDISFETLLEDLELLKRSGEIKKNSVYLSFRNSILNSRYAYKINPKAAKSILKTFLSHIRSQKGKSISLAAFEVLNRKVNILINKL